MREEHDNLIRGSLDFNGSGSDEEDEEILIGDNTKNNTGGNKLSLCLGVKIWIRNVSYTGFSQLLQSTRLF